MNTTSISGGEFSKAFNTFKFSNATYFRIIVPYSIMRYLNIIIQCCMYCYSSTPNDSGFCGDFPMFFSISHSFFLLPFNLIISLYISLFTLHFCCSSVFSSLYLFVYIFLNFFFLFNFHALEFTFFPLPIFCVPKYLSVFPISLFLSLSINSKFLFFLFLFLYNSVS